MTNQTQAAYFDQYRKSLISLTEKAAQYVNELSEDETFKRCSLYALGSIYQSLSILNQNVFPIALFAKFQAGKSTTAAAMADGREINPCGRGGGGIRTSTVPVTIYNDDKDTSVKINLFRKDELTKFIIDAVGEHLKSKDSKDPSDPFAYDLDNPQDRASLKAAVEKELNNYANSTSYDFNQLDLLRDAILILAFYGSNSYKKLVAGDFSTIELIQPFLTDRNRDKWDTLKKEGLNLVFRKNSDNSQNFNETECLHVFIRDIEVPVQSKFMRETGTSVIDAPGIMANLKDTERALQAARNSAVVVFVVNGDRQFSQEDTNQLQALHQAGMANKMVFAVNFSESPQSIVNKGIEKSILSSLATLGYNAPHHSKLMYYDAYLAMRAFQGEKILLEKKLDDLTRKAILEDAKHQLEEEFTDEKTAWEETTAEALHGIRATKCEKELKKKGLTEDIIKEIYKLSQWEEMISTLREHVVSNRGGVILYDLGVKPVRKALENIEQTLLSREKMAEEAEASVKAEYEAAKRLLDKFSARVNELLAENLDESIDKALAMDYYDDVVVGAIEPAANEAAPKVFDETGLGSNIKSAAGAVVSGAVNGVVNLAGNAFIAVHNLFSDKSEKIEHRWVEVVEHEGIDKKCGKIIKSAYENAVSIRGTAWIEHLEECTVYKNRLKQNVLSIQRQLINLWQEFKLDENTMLAEVPPLSVEVSGSIRKDVVRDDVKKVVFLDTTVAARFQIVSALQFLAFSVAASFAGYAVFNYTILLLIPGGQFIAIGAAVLYALKEIFLNDEKKAIEEVGVKIGTELSTAVHKSKKDIMQSIIKGDPYASTPKPGLKDIREFYLTFFRGILAKQRTELENIYQEKLNDLKKTTEEREFVRQKAEQWRTQRITPLRLKLADAEEKIKKFWGEGE